MTGALSLDKSKALAWAETAVEPKRWFEPIAYFWFQILPSVVGRSVTLGSLLLFVLRIAVIASISTAIVWKKLFETNAAPLSNRDWLLASILALLAFTLWILDKSLSYKRRKKRIIRIEEDISLKTSRVINTMRVSIREWTKKTTSLQLNEQIDGILQCMEARIRLYRQREDHEYLNVSLLVFSGSNGERLSIRARANPKRKLIDNVDATESAAFYAAKCQRVKVIHHFKRNQVFPAHGLSDRTAPYQSILLLPLEAVIVGSPASSQRRACKGLVSIDSERPYEFWGVAETDIEVQLRPFLSVLNMMLTEHTEGIQV